ncbi:DNA-directed RNA polymerases I, II, and III subunit RPABC1 [Strongyloides ratti]|uniref:DNA-directed RNA polymerases I, II, and III subunit RPABC1 n=1 Tax=Strongyloides ratti TaxID=34506 RepID=A0A090MZQ0_STRRB|nr:DNA-directed RNA polymerases I, II, and III subunit RPABC1 [Strongyloides ratti]CEF69319.2 DNA-directed RNA polymerases I, II, and III subunit RPABC1 [Strongyloides ratti]
MSLNDDLETSKLWRIRRTLTQMCHDRGYLVTDDELNLTLEQFKDTFGDKPSMGKPSRSDLTMLVAQVQNEDDQMYIFFPDDAKVGIKTIKAICGQMQQQNVARSIIVVQNGITPSAKQFNITEHELVPEHIVMTEEEKRELLKRYRVAPSQLPRMQVSDPIARYYGLKRGQVVKIVRPSETAGRYVSYRVVA